MGQAPHTLLRLAVSRLAVTLGLAATLPACGGSGPGEGDRVDGEHDGFVAGKADGAVDPESALAQAVLLMVNDAAIGFVELDDDARLDRRAAENIIEHRDGPDGLPGTSDDDLFDDLDELDAISYVGPVALSRLVEHAIALGYDSQAGGDGGGDDGQFIDVVFSPQPHADSHNARVADLIEQAEHSLDIAMYSFSDSGINDALEDAVDRGVQVRMLFETANKDRKLDGDDLLESKSGKLEAMGVDVRWVNKIMHHKFAIMDGPRDEPERATSATVVSGSANWSFGGASKYDENTLFMSGYPELTMRLQAEFDHLWNHSRALDINPDLTWELSSNVIGDTTLQAVDQTDQHIYFTSNNFDVKGEDTFTINHGNEVSDQLVAAIEDATDSIWIASGHLRLRPVAEALMDKQADNPDMDIRVYLDGQEYVSSFFHDIQVDELEDCLEAAGTSESKQRKCMNKGFLFGFIVGHSGVDVRYKYYAYRWHFSYALQMHHKYLIIDGDELWTGSYNLSDNAEHNTFENIFKLEGEQFGDLIDDYEENFLALWGTGEGDDLYEELIEEVETADVIPLVFAPMALDHDQVDALKDLIRDTCPAVNSEEFRKNPQSHQECEVG